MLRKCCFPPSPFKERKPSAGLSGSLLSNPLLLLCLPALGLVGHLCVSDHQQVCNKLTVWLFPCPVPLQNHYCMQTAPTFTNLGREHRQNAPNNQPTKPPQSHHSSRGHFSISFPVLGWNCVCALLVSKNKKYTCLLAKALF